MTSSQTAEESNYLKSTCPHSTATFCYVNLTDISQSEKFVYLCHSVKDGSARHLVEGLSRTGDHYIEAMDCL